MAQKLKEYNSTQLKEKKLSESQNLEADKQEIEALQVRFSVLSVVT